MIKIVEKILYMMSPTETETRHRACDVRNRPGLTSFYQASTAIQRQRCVTVHRRRCHLCRRSFWNQWCAYGSLLKGSTSTNPALSRQIGILQRADSLSNGA